MTVKTWLDIHVVDGQGQKSTMSLRIKDIAFAAAQTLPTVAKIEAVISSTFADSGTPSNAEVVGYAIRVEEDAAALGGNGVSAVSSAIKTRNGLHELPGNWLLSIPGMNKDQAWDTTNRNSISTVGDPWDTMRTAYADAAIAVGDPAADVYVPTTGSDLFGSASGFDGRRAAPRPR